MEICFIVDFYPPHIGGGEIFISRIVEGLARGGDRCLVITIRFDPALPAVEERENLKVIRIKVPSRLGRFWFTIIATFTALFQARRCDLIQGSSYGGAIPSFFASRLLGKRCLFLAYEFMGGLWKNLEPNWLLSLGYRVTEKFISRLPFDRFIAISRYTRNCLRLFGIPDARLEMIRGGENEEIRPGRDPEEVRQELGFGPEDFIFLNYGRAGVSKGVEFLVDAVPLILPRVPSARFIFILSPSGRRSWKRLLEKLEELPREAYRLLPGMPRERLGDFLGAADCVVVPSLSEGFGLAVLEACTLKKRLVATDVGSIPEVVFGEYVLVQPASARALAEGCWRAFTGQVESAPPKKFHWSETVSRCRQIYREVLGQP